MLALIIIGGVLLFLGLLLLVPVGFRASYDATGLILQLKVACLRFQLYPEREKREKRTKQKKKDQTQEAKSPEGEQEKPKKQLGDLKWLLELTKPGLKALGQLRRKLKLGICGWSIPLAAPQIRRRPLSSTALYLPEAELCFRFLMPLLMCGIGI